MTRRKGTKLKLREYWGMLVKYTIQTAALNLLNWKKKDPTTNSYSMLAEKQDNLKDYNLAERKNSNWIIEFPAGQRLPFDLNLPPQKIALEEASKPKGQLKNP
jgi:hypothetical protein